MTAATTSEPSEPSESSRSTEDEARQDLPTAEEADGPAESADRTENGDGGDRDDDGDHTEGAATGKVSWDRRAWLRREGGYIAELSALCGLVFARPVLAAFGHSPETFIARGADAWQVAQFGLIVALVPVAVLATVTALFGLGGRRVREGAQLVALGGLAYLGMIQLLRIHFAWETRPLQALALAGAVAVTFALWKVTLVRVYARYLGAATLVFLGQFLFLSPSGTIVFGGRSASLDDEVAAAVAGDLGEEPPPVVVVMMDALPTATLMDADGQIDADLYPNLATLAGDSTWYRNHTTVAQDTVFAVPAALSGQMPGGRERPPVASRYPDNLFTLLGGQYQMEVEEQVTALCPDSLCPDAADGTLRPLLADGKHLWEATLERGRDRAGLPGAFGSRYADLSGWVEGQDPQPDEEATFRFYHVLMPHDPWSWLPGGLRYGGSMPSSGQFAGYWGQTGADHGLRRHVLQTQAVDEQLGVLFDQLREADLYDDALIVVTADHGYGFEPDAPVRGLAESQMEQILWTPLLVKSPDQTAEHGGGVVDEENVMSVDLVSIVAAELGIDLDGLDWDDDGVVPTAAGGPGRDADKVVLDWNWGEVRAEEGEDLISVDAETGYERLLEGDLLGRLRGSETTDLWDVTGRGLVGATVGDDLPVEEPADITFELDGPVARGVSYEQPLPLELSGTGWISTEEVVVLAVDGTVAALVHPEPTAYGVSSVKALLSPAAISEGEIEITAYLLGGDNDDPTLRPLEVTPR